MSNSWMLRPVPHGHNRMDQFRNGVASIGWPLGLSLERKTRAEIKKLLSNQYSGIQLGSAYANVDIFVNQMCVGDYVVVPNGDEIFFGKIASDYFYEPSADNDHIGNPHRRKITWVKGPVLREDLPSDLRGSLRVQRTIISLSRHHDVIEALVEGKNPPHQAQQQKMTAVQDNPQQDSSFTEVQYPLRPNLMISIRVPVDITQGEAARLGDFVKTLYFN